MKQPIVFFGASPFVLPVIAFLQKEYDLKLVVTTEKRPTDAVPEYCAENNIPYVSVSTLNELKSISNKLYAINAPVAVLAYFGLIVTQSMIDIFPKGIVNIHPSRLPQYRGPTPGQTALVLGDVRTGVSIMLLDREVDHGPVLAMEEEDILPDDTAVTLYDRLFTKGVQLLEAVLPAYLSNQLQPVEQNHEKATYTKTLTRESGFIPADKPTSPGLLDRMIRAYYPWPGVWTRATFQRSDPRHPELVSGSQTKIIKFLPQQMLQVEGKKPMTYKDFINGYPEGKTLLQQLQLI